MHTIEPRKLNMTELNLIGGLIQMLPNIVTALNKVDEIQREHEEKMSIRYSEQEYLKTLLYLYKKGQISASEAKKGLDLIFRDNSVTQIDIEQQILRLLK